jgi:methionyl-tRNA formyltransferase
MTKKSATIVFFGNERLATGITTDAPTLRSLIGAGYKIAAVVSHNEQGRSRNNRQLEIETVAQAHNIPVLLPENPGRIKDQLAEISADLGILVAYGKIIPQSIIDTFPRGIINIHPSLLPLHRGPTPIESVILSGELKTGVSVMRLVKEMDAGPLVGQQEVSLFGQETKQVLANQLLNVGADLLVKLLPSILDDSAKVFPQDNSKATYDKLLTKQDGLLDWQKPAKQLEREIRAFAGWPKSRALVAGMEVIVTEAHAITTSATPGKVLILEKCLAIGTSAGALAIESLIPAGRKGMSISAFLAGYGNLLRLDD